MFSVQITCIILRIFNLLLFNPSIGPLIKIVGKMMLDFYNFSKVYFIMLIMFAILGNINFLLFIYEYKDLFHSVLNVFDVSLGNYAFDKFNLIEDPLIYYVGIFYTMSVVICFKIVVINLIIAILVNTFSTFDSKSNGLYLSKVLNTRDEMAYDKLYGAFLSGIPPFNVIQLLFIPICLFLRPNSELSIKLNQYLMRIQYFVLMLMLFFIFAVISAVLIPLAYVIGIYDKLSTLGNQLTFRD